MAFGRRPLPSAPYKERLRKLAERPQPLAPSQSKSQRPPREQVFKNGTLQYGDGYRLTVVIKDLSEAGARIEFFQQRHLPEYVVLSEPTLRLRRQARVVWQRAGVAGLAFAVDAPAGG